MGIFSKFEQRLAGGVNSAFAKAFRAEVQPVELASAVRAAMDERASHVGRKQRPVVPNLFAIELSATDYERLTEHEAPLADELKASAAEHAETQRYTPGGPFALTFTRNDELETGVFRLRPSVQDHPERLGGDGRQAQPQFGRYAESSHAANAPEQHPAANPGHDRQAHDEWGHDEWAQDDSAQEAFEHDESAHEDEPPALSRDQPAAVYQLPGARAAHPQPSAPPYEPPSPEPHWQEPRYEPPQQRQPEPRPEAPQHEPPQPERPVRGTSGVGSPSAAAPRSARERPWLELDGERYPLLGAITVIGRDDDADVVLDDPGVSRHHCELRTTNDGPHLVVTLSDTGSTNGTFVNGNPITRHHLTDGDRVTVGRTSMRFHAGGRK